MNNLQLQDISIAFGARRCLDHVTLNFSAGRRIALCGANGSGKSTLMKIAAGLVAADSGAVIKSKDARVAYLPQSNVAMGPDTLRAEAGKAFRVQESWQEAAGRLEEEISRLPVGSPRLAPLLHEHHALHERLAHGGYFDRDTAITRILTGLGFSVAEFDKPARSFSLGWQMRLALAKTLLENPDFLLLDEPTNYLDLEARSWLLDFFNAFPGGILVVSHDRFFLDNTVDSVAELFAGSLRIYKGNYSDYERMRAGEMESLVARAHQVEEEREKLETFIRRFRAQASRASQVQSRIKQLEKLPVIEIPASLKRIHVSFPDPPPAGKQVLVVESLAKSYDGNTVFRNVEFAVHRGEKVVLVGPNGAGKSTLLRLLAGRERPDAGTVRFDERAGIAFFSMEEALSMGGGKTVLEILEDVAPESLFSRLRSLLGAFLFSGDDAFKRVRVLSGGERCRLLLLTLLLRPKNVLVLDEPTSHLDIASQTVLLEALQQFPGTVFFVSHDRLFIDGLAEKVIELDHGNAVVYNGDYGYFLWKKEEERNVSVETAPVNKRAVAESVSNGRRDHEKSKALRNALKKIDREETDLLERLDKLQDQLGRLEASLAQEEVYRDGERTRRITQEITENRQEEKLLYAHWQELEAERKRLETAGMDADVSEGRRGAGSG